MNFPYPSESREKDLRDTSPRQWGLQTVALERCRLVHLVRRANKKVDPWYQRQTGHTHRRTALPATAAASPLRQPDE